MEQKKAKLKNNCGPVNLPEPNSVILKTPVKPKPGLKGLFYPLVLLEGSFNGYSLHLMDEIGVFTLLLKRAPSLKGFSLINWFISQVFSAAVHTILKVRLLSSIKKMKKAYYIGLGLVLPLELFLACVAIYFNSYELAPRLALFYSSRYYCYLFYVTTKIIQNIVEFIHGTVVGRITDYLMLKVIEITDNGELETDTVKLGENKLLFLTRRARYSIAVKVVITVLCLWVRPGYIYYILTNEDVSSALIKRLIVMCLLNVSSLYIVGRINESDLTVGAVGTKQTQSFYRSLHGTLKIIYRGIGDCFKKLENTTENKVKIVQVRTILFLILSFGHTFFGCIILDKLKSLLVNGAVLTKTDLYYQMCYGSLIRVFSVTVLVMLSQELESIWVKRSNKRESYHESMVWVYITGVASLGWLLFFDVLSPGRIFEIYNVLNFSTRVVNLKILLKKEATLETQDALNLWSELFDAGTLFISLGLDYIRISMMGYLLISAVALCVYSGALHLFLYYNRQCEPLDILSQLGYDQAVRPPLEQKIDSVIEPKIDSVIEIEPKIDSVIEIEQK